MSLREDRRQEHRKNRQQQQQQSPLLYKLMEKWKWNQMIERCGSHPTEARYLDSSGNTALHWIVANRAAPLEAIVALVRAYPEALRLANTTTQQQIPLHIACWRGAPEAFIQLLCSEAPDTVWCRDNRRRLPLHSCCMYSVSEPAALRIILQFMNSYPSPQQKSLCSVKPFVYLKDEKGDTVFTLLSFSCRKEFECMVLYLEQQENVESLFRSNPALELALESIYEKVKIIMESLLEEAPNNDNNRKGIIDNNDKSSSVLSMSLECDICPPEFIMLYLLRNKESVHFKSANGNYPVHYAARRRGNTEKHQDPYVLDKSRLDVDRNKKYEVSLLKYMLSIGSPTAGLCNKHGKRPFDVAVESGKKWDDGIKHIVQADPASLSARRVDLRVYPKILAHFASEEIPDTLFRFFKADLAIISGACVVATEGQKKQSYGVRKTRRYKSFESTSSVESSSSLSSKIFSWFSST